MTAAGRARRRAAIPRSIASSPLASCVVALALLALACGGAGDEPAESARLAEDLERAIRAGDAARVERLAERWTLYSVPLSNDMPASVRAVLEGRPAVLRAVLGSVRGDRVTRITYQHRSLLHWAARNGHEECVDVLLERDADPRRRDSTHRGYTPLGLAIREDGAWRRLLAVVRPEDEWDALFLAAAKEGGEAVRALLESGWQAGATHAETGNTPLHSAAYHGNPEAVALLLRSGASVSATNGRGDPPLAFAASGGHLEVLDALLRHGADPGYENLHGENVLHHGVAAASSEVLRLALAALAADEATELSRSADERGMTPLHYAAAAGSAECLSLLLDVADPSPELVRSLFDAAGPVHVPILRALGLEGSVELDPPDGEHADPEPREPDVVLGWWEDHFYETCRRVDHAVWSDGFAFSRFDAEPDDGCSEKRGSLARLSEEWTAGLVERLRAVAEGLEVPREWLPSVHEGGPYVEVAGRRVGPWSLSRHAWQLGPGKESVDGLTFAFRTLLIRGQLEGLAPCAKDVEECGEGVRGLPPCEYGRQ